jgi:dTDP-4-dehydrorhamnose reductase
MAIIGASGFIGKQILTALRSVNHLTVGTSRSPCAGLIHLDLASPDVDALRLNTCGITHAIIAAAVSSVAECERDPIVTRLVNVEGSLRLAHQLCREGIRTVAFSSDYVFDGADGQYVEEAPVNPLNEYGRQKAELEKGLMDITGGNVLIIRLSKVFDVIRGSGTLLDEMASNLSQGLPVLAAADQFFCPTFIEDVVAAVLHLIASERTGIVHLCAPTKISRLQLARKVACSFGCRLDLVQEISLQDLGENFRRPLDTSMVCTRLTDMETFPFTNLEECIINLKHNYQN